MSDTRADRDLVDTVRGLFRERCTHELVTQSEQDGAVPERLWREVTEMGLHLIGIDEEQGGSGGTLLDALAVLHAAGEYAAPLPLAETMLAAQLFVAAGAQIPNGPLAVIAPGAVLSVDGDRVTGTAGRVSWARSASVIAGFADGVVFTAPVQVAREGVDLAGQPCDDIVVDGTVIGQVDGDPLLLGPLMRAAQMAGALEAISELTRGYVNERVQFGQPVGRFQAVQQHTVTLAQMATMSSLCVEQAALAAMRRSASFEISAAKQVVSKNASIAVRAAHQAHGAIGMTQEYRLQQLTRRLNTWRGDYGDEKLLACELGKAVAAHGTLHDVVAAGSEIIN